MGMRHRRSGDLAVHVSAGHELGSPVPSRGVGDDSHGCHLHVRDGYESRRLALLIGLRGRGVTGYLRGWLKTFAIEIVATDDQVPPQALREWLSFRRWSGYAFVSLVVWIPLLLF